MKKHFPFKPEIFSAFQNYGIGRFLSDLSAGLTLSLVTLFLSIALAIASGVSPERGIFAAVCAGLLTAFLGNSRVTITAPTAALAALSAAIVSKSGTEGLIIATLMAGILLILMGILKIGRLLKPLPPSVFAGLCSGMALCIAIGQIKSFFGLTFAPGATPLHPISQLCAVFSNLTTVNWQAVLVGGVSLLILILCPKISKKIPAPPIALLVGTLIVVGLTLLAKAELIDGFRVTVKTIGDLYVIDKGIPAPSLPHPSPLLFLRLFPAAFAIALLAASESVICQKLYTEQTNTPTHPHPLLIALGLGTVCSSLFGGIPVAGSVTQTSVNLKYGGKSPLAGILSAVLLLAILLVLMPFAKWIPLPSLAAILFVAAYELCGRRRLTAFFKSASKSELALFALTLLFTLLFDLTIALLAGAAGATAVRILGEKVYPKLNIS